MRRVITCGSRLRAKASALIQRGAAVLHECEQHATETGHEVVYHSFRPDDVSTHAVLQVFEGLSKVPVMMLPAGVSDQPVEVAEVAERLVELANGAPAGRVEDMAGPEVRTFESLARAYLKASGKRRAVVQVPLWGAAYREFRAGGHLAPERAAGQGTFEDYLAGRTRR